MPLLGCIADDFTGATDLGSMLVRGGMRTVQWVGVPKPLPDCNDVDAVVVSLKSRSIEPEAAVRDSLDALRALRAAGAQRLLFKYGSTFDSTPRGNIGPVAEALLEATGAEQTVFCPAFPENGRTVYRGHLFVGDALLSESGMQNHPLNPMTDPNLVRWLCLQSHGEVGLVPLDVVRAGSAAIEARLAELRSLGVRLVIADATSDDDLDAWADALVQAPLITAASALAAALGQAYRRRGLLAGHPDDASFTPTDGHAAVLAGSCSMATQRQVAAWSAGRQALRIDPRRLALGQGVVDEALAWAESRLDDGPLLISSTATPHEIEQTRSSLGEQASSLVEEAMGRLARGLVDLGVRRLVVAGGETSGAVLQALGVASLRIGPSIAPGVPWTQSTSQPKLDLALKSGNFGQDDFFARALNCH
ncbi:hypothetical protein Pla175_51090 [Pirellulimonas nuda]|uniref:3-oxo-tetronate kinase n=1 Tax=Pirellulimonas nuda TaxID=2528009 RepID=A0A518DJM0_9BACT|nr:3-oxo-tetronate kinase [Pirellulimonas nuda]QDU91679.1 hypothetical protein Pla175_51090 [Pirellulimonas nuda]